MNDGTTRCDVDLHDRIGRFTGRNDTRSSAACLHDRIGRFTDFFSALRRLAILRDRIGRFTVAGPCLLHQRCLHDRIGRFTERSAAPFEGQGLHDHIGRLTERKGFGLDIHDLFLALRSLTKYNLIAVFKRKPDTKGVTTCMPKKAENVFFGRLNQD